MNLGQAVAVCLYELIRDGKKVGAAKRAQAASSGDVERITSVLLEALQVSGYVNPKTAVSSEEKIRRLTRRLQIPAEDTEVWLGMLRQILWKLRK
jgi:tRNA/rRNA methyltransferase